MTASLEERITTLKQFITPQRLTRMERVLSYRTRHISVVLEDIYQPHNASAVLRSCDAFGIQDVHVIQQNNAFIPNEDVALGSSKWLTLHHYHKQPSPQVYESLRKNGYRIVATALDEHATKMHDLVVDERPIALAFGNELHGLRSESIKEADEVMYIPMVGFVESFNISVSVAIALSHLVSHMRESARNIAWHLSKDDMQTLLLTWLRVDVHRAEEIETMTNTQ